MSGLAVVLCSAHGLLVASGYGAIPDGGVVPDAEPRASSEISAPTAVVPANAPAAVPSLPTSQLEEQVDTNPRPRFRPRLGFHFTGGSGVDVGFMMFSPLAESLGMSVGLDYVSGIEAERTITNTSGLEVTQDISYSLLDVTYGVVDVNINAGPGDVIFGPTAHFGVIMGAEDGLGTTPEDLFIVDVGAGAHVGFLAHTPADIGVGGELCFVKYFLTGPAMFTAAVVASF